MSTTEQKTQQPAEQTEPKDTRTIAQKILGNPWIVWVVGSVIVAVAVFAVFYFIVTDSEVTIDDATITAPLITLSPTQPDVLQELYVKEGDMVTANETVARVGNQLIKTAVAGEVIGVDDSIGKLENPGSPVVTMIDPTQLRVVGSIDEDKGLSSIKIGQQVSFTVDAYGSKKFAGVVDEIVPTSNASDVVFNISNQREEQQFSIKVRYDVASNPELLNGMSARLTIFKK